MIVLWDRAAQKVTAFTQCPRDEHQSPRIWKVRETEVITPDSEHTLLDMKGMTTRVLEKWPKLFRKYCEMDEPPGSSDSKVTTRTRVQMPGR